MPNSHTHKASLFSTSTMNDCGKSASIRHESAFGALVELLESMYSIGVSVVALMLSEH